MRPEDLAACRVHPLAPRRAAAAASAARGDRPAPPEHAGPDEATLQALFLRSRNQCAHGACAQALAGGDGGFGGRLVLIESCDPRHPRFNPRLSMAAALQEANLVLMCPAHHAETFDGRRYPAAALRRMKVAHETRYDGIAATLRGLPGDALELHGHPLRRRIGRLQSVLGWSDDFRTLARLAGAAQQLESDLRAVGPPARRLYLELVEHARKRRQDYSLGLRELRLLSDLDHVSFYESLAALAQQGLIVGRRHGRGAVTQSVNLCCQRERLCIAREIRLFASRTRSSLACVLVDLDFSVLGESGGGACAPADRAMSAKPARMRVRLRADGAG